MEQGFTGVSTILALFDAGHPICTDSRKVQKGDLYFALKGERFDGNAYAQQALENGAHSAIVDDPALAGLEGMMLVENALKALQNLAQMHRRRFQGKVIGLTGSNGKTTTKELLLCVLRKRLKVQATQGNFNNEIGVPLTLLSMPTDLDVAIVEMGANACGEIKLLSEIAEPDAGLITNIGLAHLEGFGGPEGVKRGKRELFEFLAGRPKSIVFVNASKPNLLEVSEGQNRYLYGTSEHPPFIELLAQSEKSNTPQSFLLCTSKANKSAPQSLHIDGPYNLENALAAMVIGHHFGVPYTEGLEAVSAYLPTNNRSQWVTAQRNRVLLDAYNANPSSVELALNAFADAQHPFALAIIGDMGELGDYASAEHNRIAQLAAKSNVETWLVGTHFEACSAKTGLRHFTGIEALKKHLESSQVVGRTILLKGSRSMELETALPFL